MKYKGKPPDISNQEDKRKGLDVEEEFHGSHVIMAFFKGYLDVIPCGGRFSMGIDIDDLSNPEIACFPYYLPFQVFEDPSHKLYIR